MSGTNVANRFLSGGRALGFCRVACVAEGALLLLFCTAVFFFAFSLSHCFISVLFLLVCGSLSSCTISFVLFLRTRTHQNTFPPPPSCLWITVLAQIGTCTYIKSCSFPPPPLFVCACVYACVTKKLGGSSCKAGLCKKSWCLSLSLTLSRFGCVETGSLFLQSRPSQSNQKNRNAKNLSQVFLFFFFCQQRSDPSSAFPHAQSFPRLVSFFSLSYFYYFFFFVRRLTLSEPGSAVTDSRCVFHR